VPLRARLAFLRDTLQIREQDFLTFDAMRQTAQCVGRVIRSKRDYGVLIFADARYGASDKRSKLPSWVRQFLPDSHLALSTDAAVHTARAFLKSLAQPRPPNEGLGRSLLTTRHVAEIEREAAREAAGAGAWAGGAVGEGLGGLGPRAALAPGVGAGAGGAALAAVSAEQRLLEAAVAAAWAAGGGGGGAAAASSFPRRAETEAEAVAAAAAAAAAAASLGPVGLSDADLARLLDEDGGGGEAAAPAPAPAVAPSPENATGGAAPAKRARREGGVA
jgi:hypothetical protein